MAIQDLFAPRSATSGVLRGADIGDPRSCSIRAQHTRICAVQDRRRLGSSSGALCDPRSPVVDSGHD